MRFTSSNFFLAIEYQTNSDKLKKNKTTTDDKCYEFFRKRFDAISLISQVFATCVSYWRIALSTFKRRARTVVAASRTKCVNRARLYLVIPIRLSRVVSPHASFELARAKFDRIREGVGQHRRDPSGSDLQIEDLRMQNFKQSRHNVSVAIFVKHPLNKYALHLIYFVTLVIKIISLLFLFCF